METLQFLLPETLEEPYLTYNGLQKSQGFDLSACCGVKLYPGYNHIWLTDPLYEPIYALAARYDKPVAVHMGLSAGPRAHLKYCHPLVLDEVAADHPDTRFVMCHFGNPWLMDAAAVVEKNENVAADLSGLNKLKDDNSKNKDYTYAYGIFKLYNKHGGKGALVPYGLYEFKN